MTLPDPALTELVEAELLADILHELRHPGATFALPIPMSAGAQVMASGAYVLMGGMIVQGANPGQVQVRDGDGNGPLLHIDINLAGYGVSQWWWGPDGVNIENALWWSNAVPAYGGCLFVRHRRAGATIR